ncbi:MAG TPA: CoA transferase [Burkholderiaceae bacterium]|nr:CoA transferase [Burkholderiaceae bacterium]
MTRPLQGLVVLEAVSARCSWGVRLAVAFAGRIAADLGAQVIHLQLAGQAALPDTSAAVEEAAALHAFLGAGKKFVSGMSDDAASAQARDLAGDANALLGDGWLRDAAADALGLALAADAPRAIVQVGVQPLRHLHEPPASEFTVEAESGLLDLVGDAGREPVRLAGHQVAYSAGLAAYTGMVAAFCRRTPKPAAVRVSLLETALWLNWKNLATVSIGQTPATRSGQAMSWPVVRCADGWVAVVYQPHEWETLRDMLGDPRLQDTRFGTPAGRTAHSAELSGLFEASLAKLTRAEVNALAARHRLPLGVVQSPRELAGDPHYFARGFVRSVASDAGSVAMPRLPVLWGGEPFAPGRVPRRSVQEEEVAA